VKFFFKTIKFEIKLNCLLFSAGMILYCEKNNLLTSLERTCKLSAYKLLAIPMLK